MFFEELPLVTMDLSRKGSKAPRKKFSKFLIQNPKNNGKDTTACLIYIHTGAPYSFLPPAFAALAGLEI